MGRGNVRFNLTEGGIVLVKLELDVEGLEERYVHDVPTIFVIGVFGVLINKLNSLYVGSFGFGENRYRVLVDPEGKKGTIKCGSMVLRFKFDFDVALERHVWAIRVAMPEAMLMLANGVSKSWRWILESEYITVSGCITVLAQGKGKGKIIIGAGLYSDCGDVQEKRKLEVIKYGKNEERVKVVDGEKEGILKKVMRYVRNLFS